MSMTMKSVVKSALEYIKANHIEPTPENYRRVFCQEAKKYGFELEECNKLSKLASKLSIEEQEEFQKLDFIDIDGLFDFLVHKLRDREKNIFPSDRQILSEKTVDRLASLIMVSLSPTFYNEGINTKLDDLSVKIAQNPHLLNDENIQKDIETFIEQRTESDKDAIVEKTSKMSSLLVKMNKFIDSTVEKSDNSVNNLSNISNELKSLEFNDIDSKSFVKFRDQIIQISATLESEVGQLRNKLQKEQEDVSSLKDRIKDLEQNLKNAELKSSIDFLTGVLTRREFDKKLIHFDQMYDRYGDDFILVFMDLDDFKNINDTYGHDAGDFVLKTFANILSKKTPKNFIISRYGGEEFLILIPKLNKVESVEKIENIKSLVDKNSFVYNNKKIKVTFSAGVVERSNFVNVHDMFKKVDILLYKAKNTGKDRIEY